MGRQTACRQGPERRKWVKLGNLWGPVKPAHPWELQVRRASAWNGASDFEDLLLLSRISPPKRETPLHLELQELCRPPPCLFANKKDEGGPVCLLRITSLLLPFSPACLLSLSFLSPRADAVNWSVLEVHINTQSAKETSWQRNIIITS